MTNLKKNINLRRDFRKIKKDYFYFITNNMEDDDSIFLSIYQDMYDILYETQEYLEKKL
jgi:hypothetical protein